VVDHRAVELERAGDFRLAAKDLDKALRAVHGAKLRASNSV